ncbi:MMPL family transporter [Clostridium celatum]|uniref:MMPL family transporter n=1 Tax=Clostridium celatum TaxID=36834 RepID=UPI00319E6E6C
MEALFKQIVKHKKIIISIFSIAVIVCAICSKFVSVNYDMNDYLPDGSASTTSLEVMEEEFGSGIPNARVMVSDISIPKALELKDELSSIDGVQEVTWLDDAVDITKPIQTLDSKTVEDYYKDNSALFSVTISEDKRISAVNEIRELIGDDNSMSGAAVNTATATQSTTKEVSKIILFIIPICLGILLITTTSWIEPILFMLTIGVAIMLNRGTNLLFGEISFVTNAAGNVLQLAVSMDYAIFLLHRFSYYRKEGFENEEAMVKACVNSVGSIFSSGITTVIGFAALILMRFKIGPDMGIVMAKAIVFSLITVLVLLPVITLYACKLIDKTTHKSLVPEFNGFAKVVYKLMIPMIILFSITIVPFRLAQAENSFDYGSSKIFNETTKL